MSKKINFNIEQEMALLEAELEETQKIYDQVKGHYDKVLSSKSTATFKFITDQTSNIMNIRSNRVGIIKEMVNVKKLTAEMQFKELNLNKDDQNSANGIKDTARAIYDLMKTDNRKGNITDLLNRASKPKVEENTDTKGPTDEELLEMRMNKINAAKKEETIEKQKEERPFMYACDMNGKLYAINLEGTDILEGIDLPEFEISFETDELTGEIKAVNEFGDEIMIIEID